MLGGATHRVTDMTLPRRCGRIPAAAYGGAHPRVHCCRAADHPPNAARVERARLVYSACLYYTVALTAVWLLLIATGIGGGKLFANYRLTLEQIAGTVIFMVIFWVIWSYGWYFLKRWLLRRAGFDRDGARGGIQQPAERVRSRRRSWRATRPVRSASSTWWRAAAARWCSSPPGSATSTCRPRSRQDRRASPSACRPTSSTRS